MRQLSQLEDGWEATNGYVSLERLALIECLDFSVINEVKTTPLRRSALHQP